MGLKVENLSVGLSGEPILRDVEATFQEGRICVILGPNGAGKSTLLKAMMGLLAYDGEISLTGQNLNKMNAKEHAKAIAYLPQDYSIAWDIVVRDVVALGRFAHGDTASEAIKQAMIATDTLKFADRTTGRLSGGELARVMLARVLAGQPDWILADEPLASLDPAYQLDMVSRFREIADQGTAVLIVLHDINLAVKLADDVLMLKSGSLLAAGNAVDVLTAKNLGELYDIAVSESSENNFQMSHLKQKVPI